MNITEFLQQTAGKWFSQRTAHQVEASQTQTGKSTLYLDFLPSDDPQVQALAQRYGLTSCLAGTKLSWEGTIDPSPTTYKGERLLVWTGSNESPTGQFFSSADTFASGNYCLGDDEILTLTVETEDRVSEDRIWFASENFRLRTSLTHVSGQTVLASLCTEIRLGGKPS